MAQLDPSRYKRLTRGPTYGQSDGLYWDATGSRLVAVVGDTVVAQFSSSGVDDLVSGETRGDILRRGASAWERHVALTSGQVLLGDGTDVVSTALTGDVTVNGSGVTVIGATKVLASMLGANLARGHIPLDIGSLRIIAGDVIGNTSEGMLLDGNTAPSLQRVNGATDKALRVIWDASSSVEVQFPPIAYPGDLDDAANVTVHLLVGKDTNTDNAAVIDVQAFEGVGDTEMGGNTAALATASVTEYSVTLTAANIAAHPNFLNIALVPGTHTTDAIHLYAAWVEYARKS